MVCEKVSMQSNLDCFLHCTTLVVASQSLPFPRYEDVDEQGGQRMMVCGGLEGNNALNLDGVYETDGLKRSLGPEVQWSVGVP
ncbi:hypothetical protein CIPAW_01G197900 [Carya illinoinensis]|uniref:Uncharacterized protein n=1 Tax=Carya illinoinensis TaxID=32201 RepID=A0A8T1RN51_CARIL|nr:hypothetical protein CIPAW_01G197900 [Carya illinoinensis]